MRALALLLQPLNHTGTFGSSAESQESLESSSDLHRSVLYACVGLVTFYATRQGIIRQARKTKASSQQAGTVVQAQLCFRAYVCWLQAVHSTANSSNISLSASQRKSRASGARAGFLQQQQQEQLHWGPWDAPAQSSWTSTRGRLSAWNGL